jgi:hypothetical protein
MYNCDFDKVKKGFTQYWAKENHDRPIVSISTFRDGADWSRTIKAPDRLEDRWLDIGYVIEKNRQLFSNTMYFGEGFPLLYPNLGPDILGAICGCDIEFGEDTSWAVHNVTDWETLPDIVFDENNLWWKRILQMTRDVAADAKNDYIVGVADLHPGSDALVSLRGPQEMCFDTIECPDLLKKFDRQVFEVYKNVYERLYGIVSGVGNGMTYWMGVWSDKRNYVVGSDFSCMVSPDTYEDLIAPSIEGEIDFLDQSIYHLDGPQALKHLDRVLKMKKLDAVQWVYGAGQPSPRHWIPVLQKIQAADKCIHIYGPAEDLPELMKYLKPEGLLYHCWCDTEEDAKDLLRSVTRS